MGRAGAVSWTATLRHGSGGHHHHTAASSTRLSQGNRTGLAGPSQNEIYIHSYYDVCRQERSA